MKNLITILLITLSSTSFSQSLENTEWELYLFGDYQTNITLGVDTFYIGSGTLPATAISIYNVNADTFRINDLASTDLGCFDDYGDVWGTYLFDIENDTLSMTVVHDECLIRADVLDVGVFVKAGTTSNENLSAFEDVVLYPNPLQNGRLHIKSVEPIDLISVYDVFGRLLLSTPNTSSIDLSDYPNKVFFVMLNKGDKIMTRKILQN